jgi:hypothetical protein
MEENRFVKRNRTKPDSEGEFGEVGRLGYHRMG